MEARNGGEVESGTGRGKKEPVSDIEGTFRWSGLTREAERVSRHNNQAVPPEDNQDETRLENP